MRWPGHAEILALPLSGTWPHGQPQTMQPPRSYYRITAEWDAADGGLAREVWRHFITRLSTNWWDRRRIKGV
jgi:hypothetical protein